MKTFLRIVMATTGVAVGLSSFAAQTTKSSPAAKPKANAPFANYSTESTLFNDKTLLANNMMVVTTTPYLGIRSDYAAGDLMINLPSINQDLELLQQRSVLEKRFNAAGVPFASRPIVELSGDVIGRAFVSSGYGTGRSDVDLRDAEFEINAIASSWVNAFMDIDYDRNTAPYTGDTSRVDNSRLYVNWAFINIGDLNRTPFYGTVGQMYVPFGRYGSYMITTPVTATLFQSTQRTALVGYAQNNWNAQAYAYHGPLNTNGRGNTINEGGANVSYNFATNMGQFKTGAGYITNIADADGFRDNGVRTAGVFQGFTRTDTSDQIAHRVGGVDLNGRWNNGPWGLTGEVILPTRRFAAADMQY
ncbi:MAG TPA: LbtU family siderophore porin, partial [Coxiellaceae bacterium]|nr:LbtU family siderophore porin [Coxiellaceae bacterium]